MGAKHVFLVLQLVVLIVAVFWINGDSKKMEIGGRIRWMWIILLGSALLLLGILGILAALLAYYVWSRHLKSEKK